MINWAISMLESLFCRHNYVQRDKIKEYELSRSRLPCATLLVYQCIKCLRIKKVRY